MKRPAPLQEGLNLINLTIVKANPGINKTLERKFIRCQNQANASQRDTQCRSRAVRPWRRFRGRRKAKHFNSCVRIMQAGPAKSSELPLQAIYKRVLNYIS